MAKALLGFVPGATSAVDVRLLAEVRALRRRVADLESELDRARAENAVLAASLEVTTVELPEPAYS